MKTKFTKKIKMKHLVIMLAILPTLALARPMRAPAPYHYYLGLTAGASWAKVGNNNALIRYDGGINDYYSTNSVFSNRAIVGVNTGIELVPQKGSPTFDIGFAYYNTPSPYSYYGHLNEDLLAQPASMLYGYHFNVTANRVVAETKLNWVMGQFSPYIDAGAGLAWMRAKRYRETPMNPTYPPLPAFADNTNTNFTYQLGLGISFLFNTNEDDPIDFLQDRVSLGYRYTNLGQVSFGSRGQNYPFGILNTGNMYTNDVYLTYVHFF